MTQVALNTIRVRHLFSTKHVATRVLSIRVFPLLLVVRYLAKPTILKKSLEQGWFRRRKAVVVGGLNPDVKTFFTIFE